MKIILKFLFVLLLVTIVSAQQHTFSKQITKEIKFQYIYKKPKDSTHTYPLLIFLHGAGERGEDVNKLKIHGPLKKGNEKFTDKFAILAPQCPDSIYWNTENLYYFIEDLLKIDTLINKNKIILTGMSMGGWGTWKLAEEHPELFYKIAPICAPVDRLICFNSYKLAKIPIKIYHGALDNVIPLQQSIDMYNNLLENKANVQLQIDEQANHDSWTKVYNNAEIYNWFSE